jgi:hypothetical protein
MILAASLMQHLDGVPKLRVLRRTTGEGRPFFLRRLPDAREGSRVTKAYGAAAATSEKIFGP